MGDHVKPKPRGRPFRSGTPRLPRQQRRESLLHAAIDCFVEHGYTGASMDAIAERGGVSKPVLYQHFDSKHHLYMEILNSSVEELYDRVKKALSKDLEYRDRVHAVVDAYFHFVDEQRSASAVIYSSTTSADPHIVNVVQQLKRSLADEFAVSIENSSGLDTTQAVLMGFGLAGLLLSSGEQWMNQNGEIPRQMAVDMITALAWSGIQSAPTAEATIGVE